MAKARQTIKAKVPKGTTPKLGEIKVSNPKTTKTTIKAKVHKK